MKIFFDTKYTGLFQHTTLISIGMVDEKCESTFYAEFSDFDQLQVSDTLYQNVILNLRFHGNEGKGIPKFGETLVFEADEDWETSEETRSYGDTEYVAKKIKRWLANYEKVEMWTDYLAYNWCVLFNQLWGHTFKMPDNVYYIPFDLCTLFKVKGIDPGINRETFCGEKHGRKKHNALWDAMVIQSCYEVLMGSKEGRRG
jgi:hypothetical protein